MSSERSRERRTLPHVICLISGTWQQLLVRQVDIQTDGVEGRMGLFIEEHSGSENRLKEGGRRRQQERLQLKKVQGRSEMRRQE